GQSKHSANRAVRTGHRLSRVWLHSCCSEQRRAIPSQVVEMETMMDLEAVLRRVRAAFVEMPGLRLTPAQATRLWGLDGPACHAVIGALGGAWFLGGTRS